MAVSASLKPATAGSEPSGPEEPSSWKARVLGSPLLRCWAAALVLAIVTAVVWPTIPSYDPFSWVVWGREVSDPQISFFVGGGPSWKPLPFLFTTVYGLFGGPAPGIWVVTERMGAFAGLVVAWRLADKLCRRAGLPRWSGWVAGVAAAAGVVLTIDWSYYFFRGASEPVLIACALWAIDRGLARRHWQAWFLLSCEGLMRPEAWPFMLAYGAWLFWRIPSMRIWVVLGLVAQPVGWFVPPWISTGQPFLAATHAAEYNGQLGSDPFATVVGRGESLQALPALGLAALEVVVSVALAWRALLEGARSAWRMRAGAGLEAVRSASRAWGRAGLERVPLQLWFAVAIIAWWVVVVAMTLDGYPGLQRFFLPAASLTCVLGGAGLARVAWLVGRAAAVVRSGSWQRGDWSRSAQQGREAVSAQPGDGAGSVEHGRGTESAQRGGALATGVAAVVMLAILAGSYHYVAPRITFLRQQEPLAATAVTRIDDLGKAVHLLGGKHGILPCRSSVVTINHSLQTAFAWQLGTTLERVQTVLFAPGVAFVGPHDSIDGGPPPIAFKYTAHLVRTVGAWKIYRVARAGQRPGPCVGA